MYAVRLVTLTFSDIGCDDFIRYNSKLFIREWGFIFQHHVVPLSSSGLNLAVKAHSRHPFTDISLG